MTLNTGDQAFYNDRTRQPVAAPDLAGNMPLDGRVAQGPNTSSRYLAPVGLDDSSRTTTDNSGKPCDYITTKFNADKDGVYRVEIRNHNIYLTKEDGTSQEVHPERQHPYNRGERDRRDANYYNRGQNDDFADMGPPMDSSYARFPRQPRPFAQADCPPEYGRPHIDAGQLLLGIGLGFLTHGRAFGGFHHGFGGYGFNNYTRPDYERYESRPIGIVGYNPNGFMPVSGPQYWGNSQRWNNTQRFYQPRSFTYEENPQYTSADYPGNFYYDS